MLRKIAYLLILLITILLANSMSYGQNVVVTDNDLYPPDPTAMLDVMSDSKGLLIPRLTTTQREAIVSPAIGLLVYDSDLAVFYYYNESGWINISKGQVWDVNSNYVYLSSVNSNVGIGTSTPNSKLEVQADVSFTVDDTLFCVKDKDGNAVFAVFPDGVKVIVDEGAKGKIGGFAISGRSPTKAGTETDIFIVTPDSTRIFVNDTITSKGKLGGFAISGRSPTKGFSNDYLLITGDSTRLYVNDSTTTKGKLGGFAISGRSPTKDGSNDYLHVTRDSTRVYITESNAKGKLGGFAISGRSPTKAGVEKDYFNISANNAAEKINNETRIMWYPEKSAFLGGEVHVGSADSVGTNSTALGYRSISMGDWSQAFGYKSIAYGTYATAIGSEAEADTNSLAIGYQAKATGNDSYALGSGALALGNKSFAFGSVGIDSAGLVTGNTQATGEYAFAFGLGAEASDTGSFAMGANVLASGKFSTALGYYSSSLGMFNTTFGAHSEASEFASTAMGYYAKASNDLATAIGSFSEASGFGSIVLGRQSKAINSYGIVIGAFSEALAYSSVAIGIFNSAPGSGGVAIGRDNVAGGGSSIAIGRETETVGYASFACGYQSIARGYGSFASGRYTDADGSYSTAMGYQSSTLADYNFAIGRADTARADYAMAFGYNTTASGEISTSMGYRTTAQSSYSLVTGRWNVIAGNADLFSFVGTDPLFVVGNGESNALRSNALTLLKNGAMTIAGALTQNSDERLKENILNMENVLPNVLQINPVYFEFKNKNSHPAGQHIGFIAQEIEPLFPELVQKDSQGYLSVEYANMTAVLLQAIKEQQAIINTQNKKNEELELQLKQIMERLETLENK